MNKLLSDDAYFSEWFEGLESVKAMQTVQQELLENNRQLAGIFLYFMINH